MDYILYMTEKRSLVEQALEAMMPANNDVPVIADAMRYSLLAGGKRLRPILAIMSSELFDGEEEKVLPFACCIEMIHTYSLIHDDLPSMDNDDLRRGKPTNHKVFGEGFAVLAGDALLNYAFECMAGIIANHNSIEYIKAMGLISKASGISGMIGGQCIDLHYENREIDLDTLKKMHSRKTGALITASLGTGAIIAGAGESDIKNIMEFGDLIGLAFQIADDILDVEGTAEKLGKGVKKDAGIHKSNFISFYGNERSRQIAGELVEAAKLKLGKYGNSGQYLCMLADYIINREN